MPAGRFLSEGAFKRVFAVGDGPGRRGPRAPRRRRGRGRRGGEGARDLDAPRPAPRPRLLPELCGSAFASRAASAAWGGARQGNRKKKGARWLYARMELCGHGDVEGWLRSLPGGALPGAALALFFQMCFSLYASRAALGLRHYDVKLLNFLAAPVAAATVARYAVGPAAGRFGPLAAVLADASDHLLGDAPAGAKKKKAATKAARRADQRRARVRKRFAATPRFDLETGDAPAIARCRARFGENLPLLKAMLAFDAAQRPTMRALLLSPLFAPLQRGRRARRTVSRPSRARRRRADPDV
ncbi:hypothetical protein JL720_16559 [Aureococcus anophagefferens]|nr:hypothetical protein JL720_16559 [Aureococcus anophagefferens]